MDGSGHPCFEAPPILLRRLLAVDRSPPFTFLDRGGCQDCGQVDITVVRIVYVRLDVGRLLSEKELNELPCLGRSNYGIGHLFVSLCVEFLEEPLQA